MFATIAKDPSSKAGLLWDEKDGRIQVVGRLASIDEAPEDIEVFRFDVPTTDAKGQAVNMGFYPTLDADGAPLWEGARIAFRIPSHYINTDAGEGVVRHVDQYGGLYMLTDEPLTVYDQRGFIRDNRREIYAALGHYNYEGPLKGARQLKGKLGDRHEHGEIDTFARLIDDPRSVATLERSLAAAPGAR